MVNGNLAYSHEASIKPDAVVNDSKIKWCTVSLSDVVSRNKRLEASVFDIEAKQARELISNGKYNPTPICGDTGIASAYTCGRFKRIWVKESAYPIYQPSTIMDIKPTQDGFISAKTKTNIDALRVHQGQLLMTCSGTIGKTAYVSKTLDNLIFSHDLLRITCNHPYDAGYLYTYLKSKVGNKILLTNSYGAVITHIEAEHLETVPVPNAPIEIRQRIDNLIKRSFELRDESNELIDEATQMLINELQLPPLSELEEEQADVNSFSVKLSDMKLRLDASYHLPIVDAITAHLQKHAAEVTTIGDKRISDDVILPGRFKRVYVEEGHGKVLFGGKQIHELDPSNKKYLSLSKHSSRISNELEIQENSSLITRSGTIGKVTLTPKHWEHWVASEHIIRVVPASNDIAGYINIFLASEYGFQLITHHTYGSVVDEIDDNHVREIPVPLLKNQDVQQQINTLALEANAKRYEAYQLEQEALRIMDEEVIYAK